MLAREGGVHRFQGLAWFASLLMIASGALDTVQVLLACMELPPLGFASAVT